MTDALLVSDQQIDEGFLPQARSARIGFSPQNLSQDILAALGPISSSGNNSFYGEQTLQGYGLVHYRRERPAGNIGSRPQSREAPHQTIYLWRGKAALESVSQIQEHMREKKQVQEEMQWLARNRSKFLGQWIALQGEHLLAVGSTAKEVFSQVSGQETPPLVIRIADEELPFAGW